MFRSRLRLRGRLVFKGRKFLSRKKAILVK